MDGEPACALEPSFAACTGEGLQEREAVARGAVTEAVPLLVAVGAGPPRQLGAGEEQVLVQVIGSRSDHSRGAVAPLEPDDAVIALEAVPRDGRPGRESLFDNRLARENGRGVAPKRLAPLTADLQERMDVARE